MRNKHPGKCYRCGNIVAPGEGHFERWGGGWRVQHDACAIVYRGTQQNHRTAPAADVHECPIDGCTAMVADRFLMCRSHWRRVPTALQSEVYDAWARRGHDGGLQRYRQAREAAIAAVEGVAR